MATLVKQVMKGFEGSWAEQQKKLDELLEKSHALADGELIDGVISFQVADGYAMYQVVNVKPLKVQHIPFGDAYRVDEMTIRGMRLADVKQMLAREKALYQLFAKDPAFQD
jgi:hypothetical protein